MFQIVLLFIFHPCLTCFIAHGLDPALLPNLHPLNQLLRLLRPRSSANAAHVLGYHAEGPFLHPERRGAHNTEFLLTATTNPPIDSFNQVYGEGLDQPGVKMITAAPDIAGVMDCIENLTQRGVTFSIGHSDANLGQAQEAVDHGARMITHLFK